MPRFCCRFGKEPKTIVTISVVREFVFNVYGVNVRASQISFVRFSIGNVGRRAKSDGRHGTTLWPTDDTNFRSSRFRTWHEPTTVYRSFVPEFPLPFPFSNTFRVGRIAKNYAWKPVAVQRRTSTVSGAIDVQYYCAVYIVRNQKKFVMYCAIRKILRRILLILCDIQ